MSVAQEFIDGASTLPLKGAALVAAKRMDGIALSAPFSASLLERNILMGLAYTESYFDSNAVGDAGAHHGWFQMETGRGVTEKDQVEHAIRRLRSSMENLSEQVLRTAARYVERSPEGMILMMKAAWQVAERRFGEWIASVQQKVSAYQQVVNNSRKQGAGPYAGMSDEEAIISLLGGSIQGPADFVTWLVTKGAKLDALETGQRRMRAFEEYYKWVPASHVTGDVKPPPSIPGFIAEEGPSAAKEAFSLAGRAVSSAIGSVVGGVAHGAQQVLPYVGMALGGWLLYKLWDAARAKQRTVFVERE